MTRFETGKTYRTSHVGDSQLFSTFTVISRTDKTVTLREARRAGDETVQRRVVPYEGSEVCFPNGRYPMCLVLNAGTDEVS